MLDKLEQRELTEWMSLIGEQDPNVMVEIPNSERGLRAEDPIIVPEGESRLIVTKVS